MRGVRPARPLTRIPGRSRMWTLAAWHQRDARSGATSHADARRVVPSRGWRSEAGHRERQGHPNVVLLLRVVTAPLLVPTVGPVCGERTRNRGGRRPGAGRKPEDPSPGKQADRAASVPSCHRAPASRARDAADDGARLARSKRCFRLSAGALLAAREAGVAVTHHSVQGNHPPSRSGESAGALAGQAHHRRPRREGTGGCQGRCRVNGVSSRLGSPVREA